MTDEFDRIDWLRTRFDQSDAGLGLDTLIGIGDDAAVVSFGRHPIVVTVDAQVEGVHFRKDMIDCRDLGARALIAAASDIWAMGGSPAGAVVALTLPDDLTDAEFRALISGLETTSPDVGLRILGGNLSSGATLSITTTVLGVCTEPAVARGGARSGDRIYVTGELGAAALGLALLELPSGTEAIDDGSKTFIARWRRPPVHRRTGPKLAGSATAAIDLSDGLLQDLGHVCLESGVGAIVHASDLPTAQGFAEHCMRLGLSPMDLALTGGEDYELLFTLAPNVEPPIDATEIGHIVEGDEVRALDAEGGPITPGRRGYRHFA